ncbi:MAG: class I SAM-dependent methyltransferase [Flavobacteriales bacterium]
MAEKYHPEKYWSEVGQRIANREDGKNVIAGDDEPYYRYKRGRFLDLLNEVNFSGKSVLEIGSGPGGNLQEIYKQKPSELKGVDISAQMVQLAKTKLPADVEVIKINGTELPFESEKFDIVFTATVLQHNTDEEMLKKIVAELSRVSKDRVYLFERIENEVKGDELCYGRPVSYYEQLMKQAGFQLVSKKFINIRTSYYISGAIRKGLNPSTRKEGEPLNTISTLLQKLTLPVTRITDKIFTSSKDLARLEFKRVS